MKTILATLQMCWMFALAADAFASDAFPFCKKYSPVKELNGVAHSYACPTLFDLNGDGLLDLIVGEITADCKGKVRIYLNRGTPTSPDFADFAYLQKNGRDVEFSAKGCVGLQVSFGKIGDATMFLSTSNGKIYAWNPHARKPGSDEQIDFDLWFDHSSDERFSRLIRSCTFCFDIDCDGRDELLVSGQKSPMFWLKRTGEGNDAHVECSNVQDGVGMFLRYPEGQSHASAVVLDVTGDGVPDIVTGDTTGNVWTYFGLGTERFSAIPVMIYENADKENLRSRLGVGDLDGDGIAEILVGRQNGSVLMLKAIP